MLSEHSLFIVLFFLILLSAFFSGSETGLMAINRYRLRHMAKKGNLSALRVQALLKRPDRLLGIVLIGNTFANVMASSIATILAVRHFGEWGVFISTLLLTVVLLIFAETAPKTLAALHPFRVALPASRVLRYLLVALYPLVFIVNILANGVLRLCRVKLSTTMPESLSPDELKTVVAEASGRITSSYQKMLLRILTLERVTVEDVMRPHHEIYGIDLSDDWDKIIKDLADSPHGFLPVYNNNINQILGVLSLRCLFPRAAQPDFTKNTLLSLLKEPYYVPELTLLSQQLINFRKNGAYFALVVDEYGEIHGAITPHDILEEIVGQSSITEEDTARMVDKQQDGSYLVDGHVHLRDLVELTGWSLDTNGPKTLSGLVIEHLEMIPDGPICLRLSGYPIEIITIKENMIAQVRVWPQQYQQPVR